MRNAAAARLSRSVVLLVALWVAHHAPAQNRFTTVVIDAGHGGFDRGGIPRQRVPEKVIALDVAQRLARELRAAGYRTVMTRDSDVFVPLGQRVAIANAQRNAIFISVHFNSGGRLGANGIETYYYSYESAPVASSIHANVLAVAPSENRGVRRRGYFVLRRTRIPAVLVECGFLTNPTEARLAMTSGYRQRLAEQIARGIRNRPTIAARSSTPRGGASEAVPREPFLAGTTYRVDSRGTSVLDGSAAVDQQLRSKKKKRKRSSATRKSSRRKKSSRSSSSR